MRLSSLTFLVPALVALHACAAPGPTPARPPERVACLSGEIAELRRVELARLVASEDSADVVRRQEMRLPAVPPSEVVVETDPVACRRAGYAYSRWGPPDPYGWGPLPVEGTLVIRVGTVYVVDGNQHHGEYSAVRKILSAHFVEVAHVDR